MFDLRLSAVITGFVFAVLLLHQFNQDMVLPQWLAPFSLGSLLSILIVILPWIQKGYFLAVLIGYVLMAVLLFNALVLLTVAHLSGQRVISLSTTSSSAAALLLTLLSNGLGLIGQVMIQGIRWGINQLKARILSNWNIDASTTAIVYNPSRSISA